MLKRYYYPVNPLCAMAAQSMKTIIAKGAFHSKKLPSGGSFQQMTPMDLRIGCLNCYIAMEKN
jgi:hypothetical protein